jgi:hypothetical protein
LRSVGLQNNEMKQTKPAMARMARSSLLISVLYGRLTRALATLALCAPLLGCDDYEAAYPDVSAAQSQGAFSRGWVPPMLPTDARNIVEVHNIDTNRTWGCFDAPSGPSATREKLMAVHARRVTGPVGPAPTKFLVPRSWWPASMASEDVEAYELKEGTSYRLVFGIEGDGHRVCFYRARA